MKKLLLAFAFLCLTSVAYAQPGPTPTSNRPRPVPSLPATPCSERDFVQLTVAPFTAHLCQNALWSPVDTAGGTVTNIATSSPITGGPITTTGAIACPTCATGPGTSIDLGVPIFNGTTGKRLRGSGASITLTPFTFQLGGKTSSFPALGASGSELRFIKADNSTYTDVRGATLYAQTAFNAQNSTTLFSTLSTDANGNTLIKETEKAPIAASVALAGAGAGNVTNGAHTIKVTCTTPAGSSELGTASGTVTVADNTADGKVAISSIPLCSAVATGRKVYMTTVAAPTVYKLLSNGTIADNTTTTLTANDSDATLAASTTGPSTNTAVDARLTVGQSTVTTGVPLTVTTIKPSADSTDAIDITKADGTTKILSVDTTNGFVGVSTGSPGSKLYVNGGRTSGVAASEPYSFAAQFSSSTGAFYYGASNSATPAGVLSNAAGAARATFNNDGSVQFNTYGAGTATFDASGNITSVSDERVKRNIRPFTRGLKDLIGLRPILYGYTKASGLDQTKNDYVGFTAQNVQKFIPEAVGRNADGMLTFNDRPVNTAMLNAVLELNARVEKLSKQVAAQQRIINRLRRRK